jgi:hypothetical protein
MDVKFPLTFVEAWRLYFEYKMLWRIPRIMRKKGRKEQEAGENVILRSILSCLDRCN